MRALLATLALAIPAFVPLTKQLGPPVSNNPDMCVGGCRQLPGLPPGPQTTVKHHPTR